MRTAVKTSALATIILGTMIPAVTNASNGYFSHGYGTAEKGLAGAGTAYSQSAMAAATNPAGMAFVGGRTDLGISLFNASPRGYTVTGTPVEEQQLFANGFNYSICDLDNNMIPTDVGDQCYLPFSVGAGSVQSENELFLVPSFGINWQLSDDLAVGFSVYGNGGLNTQYTGGTANLPEEVALQDFEVTTQDGVFGDGVTGVSLEQMFLNLSLAQKISSKTAIGVSFLTAKQRFSAQGLQDFENFSLNDDALSSNNHDYSSGHGIRLGLQTEIAPNVRLGASYQSKIQMSKFHKYSGLFAGGGELDIPSTYNIGVAIDLGQSGILVLDAQRINYTDSAAFGNSIASLRDGSCLDELQNRLEQGGVNGADIIAEGAGCLGGADGAGFGWQDITVVKLGYQFDVDNMTYRFGYSHSDEVIPESEVLFNILAPATITRHLTAGFTARIGADQEFNFAGMYAPRGTQKGDNPFDQGYVDGNGDPLPGTQIEIEMSQWELEASWSWKY